MGSGQQYRRLLPHRTRCKEWSDKITFSTFFAVTNFRAVKFTAMYNLYLRPRYTLKDKFLKSFHFDAPSYKVTRHTSR
jgi:hypothetical protein